jgi:hypothetical protein
MKTIMAPAHQTTTVQIVQEDSLLQVILLLLSLGLVVAVVVVHRNLQHNLPVLTPLKISDKRFK